MPGGLGRGFLCTDRIQQVLHEAAVQAHAQFLRPGLLPDALTEGACKKPAEMPLAGHMSNAPLANFRRAFLLLPAARPGQTSAVAVGDEQQQKHALDHFRGTAPSLLVALDGALPNAKRGSQRGLAQSHLSPDLPDIQFHASVQHPCLQNHRTAQDGITV